MAYRELTLLRGGGAINAATGLPPSTPWEGCPDGAGFVVLPMLVGGAAGAAGAGSLESPGNTHRFNFLSKYASLFFPSFPTLPLSFLLMKAPRNHPVRPPLFSSAVSSVLGVAAVDFGGCAGAFFTRGGGSSSSLSKNDCLLLFRCGADAPTFATGAGACWFAAWRG